MYQIYYLDVDDVLDIFEKLVGPVSENLRSRELLESAVLMPQQTVFGKDAYPTLGQKAWAYMRGLAQNHAFVDGNKRIAWATTRAFLLVNRIGIRAEVDVVEDLVVRLAANQVQENEVIAFLDKHAYQLENSIEESA